MAPQDPPAPNVPTYWDYLRLDTLLSLQGGLEGDESALVPDELLFIVVHQSYELWFKMVLRELTEGIDLFVADSVDEDKIPYVVHHLRRAVRILELSVDQFAVMETLTPQDFLGFRDKLVPASGFQSWQMRELELRLGLEDEQREKYGAADALSHIRSLTERSPTGASAWGRIEKARADAAEGRTLQKALQRWLQRTPIEGSLAGSEGDAERVEAFLESYHAALVRWFDQQAVGHAQAQLTPKSEIDARFADAALRAREYLFALDLPVETPPEQRLARRRARAGLLFIESHRDLPLLAWPRLLLDTVVELEEQLVLFRHRHARMVERVIGRRVGTGGSSGVDYLDRTTKARIFGDLWAVRTLLMPKDRLPPLNSRAFYGFATRTPTGPESAT
jgi:tryptophan 2,3-dioxygenase